jgi:hypothetical protein
MVVAGLLRRGRDRGGAWFHSACIRHWDPTALLEVLDLSPDDRESARLDLGDAVIGVVDLVDPAGGGVVGPPAVATALIEALPG